jgi:DHA1 family tetracycline resistance protein-like MFS transporter
VSTTTNEGANLSEKQGSGERDGGSRSLGVLFSVIVVDLIGFGIVVPILPFWSERFGASGAVLGLLLASHAAMQFLFSPVWGKLSDRLGRRPVMLVTIAGTALSLLFLGLADSLAQLFAARLLSGVFGSNTSVATAYLTDVTEEADRTRWMGMIGACFAVGFTLGPPIGGLLSRIGHEAPMLFAAGLAAINFIWAALRLTEPERRSDRPEAGLTSRLDVLRAPLIGRVCLVYFLFSLAVTQLETTFAFFMSHRYGYDELGVGLVMLAMAIVMGGIQGGGMKRLSERYAARQLVLVGLGLMTVAFAMVPFSGTVTFLMLPLGLAAVGRGISQPPMMSLVSLGGDEGSSGLVMGVFQSTASAARIVGPIAAGLLYDLGQPFPYYLAAALTFVAALIALNIRPAPRSEQPL